MLLIGICEGDDTFRQKAKRLIEKTCKEKGKEYFIFEFSSMKEVQQFYFTKKYELDSFFLNTELEGHQTISLAKEIKIQDERCQIVFWSEDISNQDEIYEVEHSYYVEKRHFEERIAHIYQCVTGRKKSLLKRKLILEMKGRKQIINQDDIQYIERFKRITNIYQVGKDEVITISKKLDELQQEVNEECFVRCHNSYLVNLDYVSSYERTRFVLLDGTSIPISRKYQDEVKKGFHNWEIH